MMHEANHSLSSRRDAREQEQLIASTTGIAIEMAKPFVRFQSDLISTWANGAQVMARMFTTQAEAFAQYSQEQLSQLQQNRTTG